MRKKFSWDTAEERLFFDEERLWYALKHNDMEGVKEALSWPKIRLDWKQDEQTLLNYATANNMLEAMELLIDGGVSVEARSGHFEWTPLMTAASHLNEPAVRLLLSRGADINAQNSSLDTALHRATCKGGEKMVRLLLDNGADIDRTNYLNETALHWAISANQNGVARLLLEYGSDPAIKENVFQRDCLAFAADIGQRDAVISTLQDAPAIGRNARNERFNKAVHGGTKQTVSAMKPLALRKPPI